VTQRQGSQRTREFKNPLAQAFGLVLYRIRRSSGLSTQATAAAIGIADAGYRLIEAGSAVFQPGHSLSLVNLFVELEWGRVALALSAIQILEREREDASLMERRAEDVRALDPGLEAIMERLRPAWTLIKERKDDAVGVVALLENNGVVDALHRYLKQPMVHGFLQAGSDGFGGVRSLIGVIEKISPFHFDMVVQQVRELSEFPPFVSPGALAKWEHRHHARISRIYGIVAEPRILELSDASGSTFNWQYVWRESFEGAFILSLNNPEDVPDITADLWRSLLSKSTKQTPDAQERSREFLRKQIVIEPAKGTDICAKLSALMDAQYLTPELVSDTSSDWKYRNIWLYHMSDTDTVVGFADTSGPSESSSYTSAMLSFRSVMRVLHTAEAYWHTLLDDRNLPLLDPTSVEERTKQDGGGNV
jgi:hypothetical protein